MGSRTARANGPTRRPRHLNSLIRLMKPMTLRSMVGLAALAAVLAACDKPQALGDANAMIAAMPEPAWEALQADIEDALEPRAFTVRDERIFRVTPVDPDGPYWGDTRRFRQILIVGEPAYEPVAEVISEAGGHPPQLPAIVEATNVWSRGQHVYAIVLQPGAGVETARPLLAEVGDRMLERYRTTIQQRMFASGADTARAQELERDFGFRLLMPAVYRTERPDDRTHMFVNDQPDPAQLQRVILVTERPASEAELTPEAVLAWREEIAERYYDPPHLTDRERMDRSGESSSELDRAQIHGVWSSPPGAWPAAGPFITRVHLCPDGRALLLDGWVYAPGREKYEYMFQVNTILDSFRCGPVG
jgi:hypothetical protein